MQNMTNNSIPIKSYTDKRDPCFALASEQDPQKQNESSSNVDLLSEKLSALNDEKNPSKKQFYRESYSIFHELKQTSKPRDRDINGILSKFIDLTYKYTEAHGYIRIWDLCQRLYFPIENTDLIISLRDWLSTYDEIPNVDEARSQDEDEELEEINSIGPTWMWEYSRRHLLRGNLDESRDILTFGLKFLNTQQQAVVNKIIQLIADFDSILSTSDNKTVFWEKWAIWSDQCKTNKEKFEAALGSQTEANEKNDEIWLLFGILIGDEYCIGRAGTYFEVVLGNAWFAKPQRSLSSLNSLAQEIENTPTDDACAFILMGRFDEAFSTLDADLWLQTHLGYALIITGNMITDTSPLETSDDKENVVDPVYYCIQAYAQIIAQECDMLEEAVNYLDCCQSNREFWVKQLLGPTLPTEDIARIHSILKISTECGLTRVEKFIHQGLGRRYESEKKIRQATIEYAKAEDLESLDKLAHHEFSQYLKTGSLNNVVADMDSVKNSPHYAILVFYHEFREHLSHKRWGKASHYVLRLLENEHLPSKFQTVLLIDNLQILKESTHYYSSNRVIELINVFQHVTKDSANQDFIVKYYRSIDKQDYSSDIITAKIRELLAYKAATAPAVC